MGIRPKSDDLGWENVFLIKFVEQMAQNSNANPDTIVFDEATAIKVLLAPLAPCAPP